jgi:hypothetical protein
MTRRPYHKSYYVVIDQADGGALIGATPHRRAAQDRCDYYNEAAPRLLVGKTWVLRYQVERFAWVPPRRKATKKKPIKKEKKR